MYILYTNVAINNNTRLPHSIEIICMIGNVSRSWLYGGTL